MLISIKQDEDHCQLFSAIETRAANFMQRARFLLNYNFIAMRAEFQIPLSLKSTFRSALMVRKAFILQRCIAKFVIKRKKI